MAVSTRIIKRRIKSVANTRKITRAMELVSAAKMRKAIQLAAASRDYAATVRDLAGDVSRYVDPRSHVLLSGPAVSESILAVVASSDRGLCGGFNSQLLKKTLDFLLQRTEKNIKVVAVGRRAESTVKRAGYSILASFDAISNAPTYDRTLPIGKLVFDEFTSGKADRVFVIYTDFKNAVFQIPTAKQLLPVILETEPLKSDSTSKEWDDSKLDEPRIKFEPDTDLVLKELLPRMLEMQIYQSLLESAASEHSARMVAMQSATDNASSMLEDLTFTFNQARQANITREISEISAGKAAIE
ncbi:MAG: ATP synthase F1 subunit gamma [Patescibacteria group bacterium]